MNLKKLFKNGAMAVCLLSSVIGNAMAMEEPEKVLIVGCRPWDPNIQGVLGLDRAHFADFRIDGAPEPVPATFHHLDINNEGPFPLAGRLSDFANANAETFKTILIDWMTSHHIRRDEAWADFSTLLSKGGKLIIPVTSIDIQSGQANSKEKAELLKNKLVQTFSDVEILTYDQIPADISFDFLRRPGISDVARSSIPAIIFATK